MNVRIVLGLRSKTNAEILVLSKHFTTSMTGNPLFAAADIVTQIGNTVTATTNLANAINAPTSDTRTDNIRSCRDAVDRNLNMLAGKVEAVANNPALLDDQRLTIVHSAGMEVRAQATRNKLVFAVVNGDKPGTLYATAPAGPAAHKWAITEDTVNFTNRIELRTTVSASTIIEGLKRFTQVAVFHKAVVPDDEEPDWEGPLLITVL
ncbi:hypothetical protein WSM22_35800 [Cytophagales bacterium WSM2-2]|nr:hypothetical protein WSM22_35800 [Cytophagales bacterium WSM2-2]